MKKMILITGGLGYLGGRLALALSASRDYDVRLASHRASPDIPDWVKSNDLSVVHADVLSEDSLAAACKGVHCIVHLAALNEIQCVDSPEQALQVNTLGTLKLINAARLAGVRRFIYFSTIHVYGAPLAGTITEKTLTCPTHPYAITHRAAEDYVIAANKEKKLTGIVVRLSNGFGTPADPFINRWTLVVNDLCKQAVTQRKLVLKSSGLQNRDFVTLTDVGRAVEHLISMPMDGYDDCVFNLGGENSISIMEMAEIIAGRCAEVLGYTPPIVRPKPRSNEVAEKIDYRIDKLKSTGFSILANLNEEIDATLKFCGQHFTNDNTA